MHQTTTDWLFNQLWEEPKDKMVWYAILKQAKEMEKNQIADAMQFTYMNMTDEKDFIGVDYFYETRFNGGKNICPNCKQGILRLDRPGKMTCSVC